MNRRGIELQFNWIFILIAGAVILAFFFSVVQKQRSLSEQKLSITLASQMDAIYSGAIESKGTTQPLATPRPGLAFSCSEACECNYYIGNRATEFRDKLLFAPAVIRGEDGIAWSVEWKLPFRIANFLLLTSPRVKYYLVYEQGDAQSEQAHARVIKQFPREINAETLRSASDVYNRIVPQGYDHTRFIFIGTDDAPRLESLNRDFDGESVSAVWLRPRSGQSEEVVFYEKADPDELDFNAYSLLLAGDASIYAAMFAADHSMYGCVMKRAFGKLATVARVHAKRADELQIELLAQGRPECPYILQNLQNVADAAGIISAAARLSPEDPDAPIALSNILSEQGTLQQQNNNLILQSCPELY
jgi:hypothetical protein